MFRRMRDGEEMVESIQPFTVGGVVGLFGLRMPDEKARFVVMALWARMDNVSLMG